MTQDEQTPHKINSSCDPEIEGYEWKETLMERNLAVTKAVADAEAIGNDQLVRDLQKENNEIARVLSEGFDHADESVLGKEVLEQIRRERGKALSSEEKLIRDKSDERKKIYHRQIAPNLFGKIENPKIDANLSPEEDELINKIMAERAAKGKDNKTRDINLILEEEEELEDWDDYVESQCAQFARQTWEAKDAGNSDLAKELERAWQGWILVKRLGIDHAQETGLGKKALLSVYKRRQAINASIAQSTKKAEERKAQEKPEWDKHLNNIWEDISNKLLTAKDEGNQELINKLLQDSEELGRTRKFGYERAKETKLGREILRKIRGEDKP